MIRTPVYFEKAAGLMCLALMALMGSAILYASLWLRLHKYFVLGTILLDLLAGE